MSLANKIIKWFDPFFDDDELRTPRNREEMINAEAALAATIFGAVPEGHKRQFFLYKKNLWIWHEEWMEAGGWKRMTVRYEVKENGVFKKFEGTEDGYIKLSGAELNNFRKATQTYLSVVKNRIYS